MPVSAGHIAPLCWTGDLMRVLHLDTFSTMDHASPIVQAGKKLGIRTAAVQLLQAGLSRNDAPTSQTKASTSVSADMPEYVQTRRDLIDAWNSGADPACNERNFVMTSIVVRKLFTTSEQSPWMTAKY